MLPSAGSFSKGTNIAFAVACIFGYACVMFGNYLATAGLINQTPAEMSDKYWIGISASGWTFSIWGLIFLLMAIFLVYSLVLAIKGHPLHCLPTLTALMVPNFLLNGSWQIVFGNDLLFIAYLVIIGTLVTALGMMFLLTSDQAATHPAPAVKPVSGFAEAPVVVDSAVTTRSPLTNTDRVYDSAAPPRCHEGVGWTLRSFLHPAVATWWIRIYSAWMCVATILSTIITLKYTFNIFGDASSAGVPAAAPTITPGGAPAAPSVPQLAAVLPITVAERNVSFICLAIVALLGIASAFLRRDVIPPMVFVWACFGVASKATNMHDLPGPEDIRDRWTHIAWAAVGVATINAVVVVGLAIYGGYRALVTRCGRRAA